MGARKTGIFLNGAFEFSNSAGLKVGVAISAAERHVDLGSIAKGFLHLAEDLDRAFLVVEVETGDGEIIAVGKSGIEIDRGFEFLLCCLILIHFQQRAAEHLVSERQLRLVARVIPDELGGQSFGVRQVAKGERGSRIVKEQGGSIGLEGKGFVEQRSGMGIIASEAIAHGELAERVGQKCVVFAGGLAEFAGSL